MRYELRVMTHSGDILSFPDYGETELECVTRVAVIQSWSSFKVQVFDEGELILEYVNGERTRAKGWEVQIASRLAAPERPRERMLYDDEKWRDTWQRVEDQQQDHPHGDPQYYRRKNGD